MTERLEVRGVRKAYGATVAVEHASLALRRGEVHALLGENGAGKSTLVKMIGGIVMPDDGSISLDGTPYRPGSITAARAAGVATAFQELSLLLNFSIAQNLLLPRLPKSRAGLISGATSRDRAAAILERHGLAHLDPDTEVGHLTLADRQRIEIVRAMHNAGAVLVLDEPTAALSDTDWLFELVRRLTDEGMAVLYISHRLAEVRALSARATVLRNGRSIETVGLSDASDADIFEMMVGRREGSVERAGPGVVLDERISLSARHLRARGLKDVSFDLHPGEILGIAALEGQGQQPLLRALAGLERLDAGEIRVDGILAGRTSPARMLGTGSGLAYLPEERKTEGILSGLSSAGNIVLPIVSTVATLGLVSPRGEKSAAREQAANVDLDERYLGFDIAALSGGNQQKALIARVLATGARTLVLFDPTRGVDVGTKQSIYAAMEAFARQGGSVVFYTSELPEIVRLSHRCIVLYGGRVHAELERKRLDERTLVAALLGQAAEVVTPGLPAVH